MATNDKTAAPAPSMTVFKIGSSFRKVLSEAFDVNTALLNSVEKFPWEVEPAPNEIGPRVAVEAYTYVMNNRLIRLLELLDKLDAHPASKGGV